MLAGRSSAQATLLGRDHVGHVDDGIPFAISDSLNCRFERAQGALWTTMSPTGIPCFTRALLRDMERASGFVEAQFSNVRDQTSALSYVVLQSGVPRVFNLGGDLGAFLELIRAQDREALADYARTAVNVVYRNFVGHGVKGVTTIALLEGDALGGGLECALSCDIVIAERHVKCGFPEILFNMFPGMGGLSFLTRRCGRSVTQELTRTGRQFTAEELLAKGVIDLVVDTGEGVRAVRQLMQRRHGQRHGHIAMNSIERMLAPITFQELHDVAGLWVTAALSLDARGQEWMQRLHTQQRIAFSSSVVQQARSATVHPLSA